MNFCWQSNVTAFNMQSRLVITFLPRSKCLSISWLQSPLGVILEPPKIKFLTVSTVSPSICHEVMGPDAMILALWMLSFKPAFPILLALPIPYLPLLFLLVSQTFKCTYFYAYFISSSLYYQIHEDKNFCFVKVCFHFICFIHLSTYSCTWYQVDSELIFVEWMQ